MRWWPLVATLAALTAEVRPHGDLASEAAALPATMARALERISASSRDYRLMGDLWFERTPENVGTGGGGGGVNRTGPAAVAPTSTGPPPSPGRLVQLADAVFGTHRLVWSSPVTDGIDFVLYKDKSQRYRFDVTRNGGVADKSSRNSHRRTFGVHRRRMVHMMLPIMYKLGVITTLLVALTLISLKGLSIGLLLLTLGLSGLFAKLVNKDHRHPQHYTYGPSLPQPYDMLYERTQPVVPWSHTHYMDDRSSRPPHPPYPAPPNRSQEKNIHVHVHTSPGVVVKGPPAFDRNDPLYSPPDDAAVSGPGGGSVWSYDTMMNNYFTRNLGSPTGPGGPSGPAETTTNSNGYTHFLG